MIGAGISAAWQQSQDGSRVRPTGGVLPRGSWEIGVRRRLGPPVQSSIICEPQPGNSVMWARRGKYIRFSLNGKRPKRQRIIGGTSTTLTLAPLRWYERVYFGLLDALAWARGLVQR